jgi:hypothetical protein
LKLPLRLSTRTSACTHPSQTLGLLSVVMSMTRKRSRVTGRPVLFVNLRRTASVPKLALSPTASVSRTRLGGSFCETSVSNRPKSMARTRGLLRFAGATPPSTDWRRP